MRSHRRDALRNSEDAKSSGANIVSAPVRQGRRAAVMPTDMLLMERPSISAESVSGDDAEIPGLPGLAGLSLSDLPPFLTGLSASTTESINDEEENERESGESSAPTVQFRDSTGNNVSPQPDND